MKHHRIGRYHARARLQAVAHVARARWRWPRRRCPPSPHRSPTAGDRQPSHERDRLCTAIAPVPSAVPTTGASPVRTSMRPSRCRYPLSPSSPPPAHPARRSRAFAGRSPHHGARDHRALTDGADDDDDRLPVNPTTTVCDLPTAARARSAPRRAHALVVADADDRQAALRNPDTVLPIPLWVSPAHRCRSHARSVNGADHDRPPHFRRILNRHQAGDEVPPRELGRSIPERVRHSAGSVVNAP